MYWLNLDESEIHQFVFWMEEKLNVKKSTDWYRIGTRQMEEIGCSKAVQELGGVYALLNKVYPDIFWDQKLLTDPGKKSGLGNFLCD